MAKQLFEKLKAYLPPEVPSIPDGVTKSELDKWEQDRKELENTERKHNILARKKYAHRVFCVMVGWLLFVMLILLFCGLRCIPFCSESFILSDAVIIALITTTTINVIFLFNIILKNLFPGVNPK